LGSLGSTHLRREGFNVSAKMNFGLSKKLVGLI
jgi:hypothetical protein